MFLRRTLRAAEDSTMIVSLPHFPIMMVNAVDQMPEVSKISAEERLWIQTERDIRDQLAKP